MKHSAGEVGGDHPCTVSSGKSAALGGAGTDLQKLLAAHVAQQPGVGLA
jgi:hypothetical protein